MQPGQTTNSADLTMEVVPAAPRCQLLLIILMAAMLLPGMKGSPLLVRRKIARTIELQESISKVGGFPDESHNGLFIIYFEDALCFVRTVDKQRTLFCADEKYCHRPGGAIRRDWQLLYLSKWNEGMIWECEWKKETLRDADTEGLARGKDTYFKAQGYVHLSADALKAQKKVLDPLHLKSQDQQLNPGGKCMLQPENLEFYL
ncbi:hypothetical protein STEG23_026261 [Scotinomys teguina]